MPIYEYECDSHGHRFERWQSVSEAAVRVCEVCGGPVHKVFYPAGIIFKGSGWYKTDSRPKAAETEAKAEAKPDKPPETKTEKPASAKPD